MATAAIMLESFMHLMGNKMKSARHSLFLVLLLLTTSSSIATDVDEGQKISDKTNEFSSTTRDALRVLGQVSFFQNLKSLSYSARQTTPDDVNKAVSIVNLGKGDAAKTYDVILQPGHYGRTRGKTGAVGEKTTEQKLVAFIASDVAKYLSAQQVNFLVIPADGFQNDLKAKVFLAIHADGSSNHCASGRLGDGTYKLGASLGYAEGSDLLGMHSIGFALATSMGQDYDSFRKDNFTIDEHHYYAFNKIDSSGYSGLLEVGELSCPQVENALIERAALISHNLGVALKASVDILNEKLEPEH